MKIKFKSKYFNIIGLLLGMIGVVIIFIYGPPQPSFLPYTIITDSVVHQEVLDMKNKYELFSKTGLGFIFIGFLFQFFGVIFESKQPSEIKEKTEVSETS